MVSALNEDRLFPTDPEQRSIARRLYEAIKDRPIISPHGHVPIDWFAEDKHFKNPTDLFITPDHYVTRIMHGHCVPFSELGVGQKNFTEEQSRNAFRLLGKYWYAYAGTPMRYWMEDSLSNVFGINKPLNEDTADSIYDELNELLASDDFTTRKLVKRFNIGFISTTDDPTDDLALHDKVRADANFPARLAPCFRPDRYLAVDRVDWAQLCDQLGESASVSAATYEGFVEAMRRRRLFFKQHGAVAADYGVDSSLDEVNWSGDTTRLSDDEAIRLYSKARSGTLTSDEARKLHAHLLNDQAKLAQDDGLVMTMHPGVMRNTTASSSSTTVRTVERIARCRLIGLTGCAPCSTNTARILISTLWHSPWMRPHTPASSLQWRHTTQRCTSGPRGGFWMRLSRFCATTRMSFRTLVSPSFRDSSMTPVRCVPSPPATT